MRESAQASAQTYIVFNVGASEAFAHATVFRKPNRVISLHQWRPRHMSAWHSYFVRDRILKQSRTILTYSALDQVDLQDRYEGADVRRLGHYVDTEFFDPFEGGTNLDRFGDLPDDYFLCVGDHLRLEETLLALVKRFDIPLVRVSRDPAVSKYYNDSVGDAKSVFMLPNITFEELRELYRRSTVAINAVDDRFWPVGITSFCEALSMGCRIVTSGNHSCSGYNFAHRPLPYQRVSEIFDKDCWNDAIQATLSEAPDPASARQLAINQCSIEIVSEQWYQIIHQSTEVTGQGETLGHHI